MRRLLVWLLAGLALAGSAAGCGNQGTSEAGRGPAASYSAVGAPGTPALVTKNTTRLAGADGAADAAAVARAVYPGLTAATRPQAVVVVDEHNWPAAIASSALAAAPLGAPVLYADGDKLPGATALALRALHPQGAAALHGAQVVRIATAARLPGGYRTLSVPATGGAPGVEAEVARIALGVKPKPPRQVIVLAGGADPALQMPAAGLAAESGAPILWTGDAGVPAPTVSLLESLHQPPAIYMLGAAAVRAATLTLLARYGRVVKISDSEAARAPKSGRGPAEAASYAVAVARFADGAFGWGIHEAGHGLAFANASRPLDAPAAAPLASHGDYAPLLLLAAPNDLPEPLVHYLSNIEPGYTAAVGPVRAVYNHGWLIGDERAISAHVQAEIDAILEVAPRTPSSAEQPPPAVE
jgi:hypothetical protein